MSWYGGSERYYPSWPIENDVFDNLAYVTAQEDYGAIRERYWLNSRGGYIFLNSRVPLFLDQNTLNQGEICFIARASEPYIGRERVGFYKKKFLSNK